VEHGAVGVRTVDEQAHLVAGHRSPAGSPIDGTSDRLGRAPARPFGHGPPSPIARSCGRSAASTHPIWSSSGTPSSAAPCTTSSRLTPRANALSLSFFLTLETRSEEHTSELQSRSDLVCRLLLEK